MNNTIRLGLESIRNLCEALGNPQDKLQFIHIAGTNGKGSTGAFVASILKEAGLKVGHFSSPAVFSREEVIKVNNRAISGKEYDRLMGVVNEASEKLTVEGKQLPTAFEKETALAFLHYVNQNCDIIVLECGMGGATDATNIVKNTEVCIFTAISFDHMDYLGNSLEEITSVKAGIIKPGAYVVTAIDNQKVLDVITDKAGENDCEVNITKIRRYGRGALGLSGQIQNENASVAEKAARLYLSVNKKTSGFSTSKLDAIVKKGLHNTKLPGRFERICESPDIFIDGGHNPGAAKALMMNLSEKCKGKKLIGVVGMLVNKDHSGVMEQLAPAFDTLLTVSTMGERGYSAVELAGDALGFNPKVSSIGGLSEALDIAYMMAEKKDVIVVFGTFSILKEAKEWAGKKGI